MFFVYTTSVVHWPDTTLVSGSKQRLDWGTQPPSIWPNDFAHKQQDYLRVLQFTGNRWLSTLFARQLDRAKRSGGPGHPFAQMPMSIRISASYAIRGWLGAGVYPSHPEWLHKPVSQVEQAGHSSSYSHFNGCISISERECVRTTQQMLFETFAIWDISKDIQAINQFGAYDIHINWWILNQRVQ